MEKAWQTLGFSPQLGLGEIVWDTVRARLFPAEAARAYEPAELPAAAAAEPPKPVSRRELFGMFRRPFDAGAKSPIPEVWRPRTDAFRGRTTAAACARALSHASSLRREVSAMNRSKRFLFSLLALLLSGRPAPAADSAHFKQTAPANLAVIPQGATSVTLSFQIDWTGLKTAVRQRRQSRHLGFLSLLLQRDPARRLGRGGPDLEVVHGGGDRAGDDPAQRSEGFADFVDPGPPFRPAAVRAGAVDVLHQPAAPARAPLHAALAPDSPSAWPTKFVVTNDGDAFSQPSSLAVSVRRLESASRFPAARASPASPTSRGTCRSSLPEGSSTCRLIEFHVGSPRGKAALALALDLRGGQSPAVEAGTADHVPVRDQGRDGSSAPERGAANHRRLRRSDANDHRRRPAP